MIVGGNINHLTRIMTTAIALETSKGELSLALSLGIVLLTIALLVNAIVISIKTLQQKKVMSNTPLIEVTNLSLKLSNADVLSSITIASTDPGGRW